jgi:hypothetical protein
MAANGQRPSSGLQLAFQSANKAIGQRPNALLLFYDWKQKEEVESGCYQPSAPVALFNLLYPTMGMQHFFSSCRVGSARAHSLSLKRESSLADCAGFSAGGDQVGMVFEAQEK